MGGMDVGSLSRGQLLLHHQVSMLVMTGDGWLRDNRSGSRYDCAMGRGMARGASVPSQSLPEPSGRPSHTWIFPVRSPVRPIPFLPTTRSRNALLRSLPCLPAAIVTSACAMRHAERTRGNA